MSQPGLPGLPSSEGSVFTGCCTHTHTIPHLPPHPSSLRSPRICPNGGLFSFQSSDCVAHPLPKVSGRDPGMSGEQTRRWRLCRAGDTFAVRVVVWQTLAAFFSAEAFAWRQAAPAPPSAAGLAASRPCRDKISPISLWIKGSAAGAARALRLGDVKWQRSLFCLHRGGESPASQRLVTMTLIS